MTKEEMISFIKRNGCKPNVLRKLGTFDTAKLERMVSSIMKKQREQLENAFADAVVKGYK